jgi:hypothetical protein
MTLSLSNTCFVMLKKLRIIDARTVRGNKHDGDNMHKNDIENKKKLHAGHKIYLFL